MTATAQKQQGHTPLSRLAEWYNRRTGDPAYCAGNTQFGVDVGWLLESHADLLAALKAAEPKIILHTKMDCEGDCSTCRVREQVRAAIAKAEGR